MFGMRFQFLIVIFICEVFFCSVAVVSKSFEDVTDTQEEFYGMKYKVKDIDAATVSVSDFFLYFR